MVSVQRLSLLQEEACRQIEGLLLRSTKRRDVHLRERRLLLVFQRTCALVSYIGRTCLTVSFFV